MQYVDVPRTEALTVVMIAALVMCPFILFAGRLADRFGRGKVYGLASLLCGLSIFPSFWLMEGSGGNLFLIGLAIVIPLSVFYAGVFGPEARCSPTCSRRTYATPASPSYTSSPVSSSRASCPACVPCS